MKWIHRHRCPACNNKTPKVEETAWKRSLQGTLDGAEELTRQCECGQVLDTLTIDTDLGCGVRIQAAPTPEQMVELQEREAAKRKQEAAKYKADLKTWKADMKRWKQEEADAKF